MGAVRNRARQKGRDLDQRGERSQASGSIAVGAGIATGALNPAIGIGLGAMGVAAFDQGSRDKREARSERAKGAAIERLSKGARSTAGREPGAMAPGLAPTRSSSGWPPISDAITAASYAAMTAGYGVSPLSSANTARAVAKGLAGRGRDLAAGSRDAASGKIGKVADKAAGRIAMMADGKAGAVIKAAGATGVGQMLSRGAVLASKIATPLMLAKAGFDATRGYQRDGVRGAVLGGIDSLAFGRATATYNGYRASGVSGAVDGLTFGLMSWAAKHVPESLTGAKRAGPQQQPAGDSTVHRLSPDQARQFEKAEATGKAPASRPQQQDGASDKSSGMRGFQNQSTLAAALAAQGKEWSGDYLNQPRPK